ncbi:MAG: methyltransferase [Alphaproteobacteria bacterium]|nr:methyltransferase [Alphaproteobacteria bacterium]
MKKKLQLPLLLAAAIWVFTGGLPDAAVAADDAEVRTKLEAIIAGDHRAPDNAARDQYRNPLETLLFFGVRPDMTVVEIWPGGGWYTEILAPLLNDKGKYYAAHRNRDTTDERILAGIKRYEAKLAERPQIYSGVVITELSQKKGEIAPAGSADMVLTFRNVHNWMKFGFERHVFNAMFTALKPGGILGVVEHRADPNEFPDPQALSGYVQEEQLVAMAQAAGFKFAGKSEVNANPKDTRNHPKGVWTLPPSLRLKDQDREKYIGIGESDRMTMKFVKP